jgi:hypothetical protein
MTGLSGGPNIPDFADQNTSKCCTTLGLDSLGQNIHAATLARKTDLKDVKLCQGRIPKNNVSMRNLDLRLAPGELDSEYS